LAKGDAAHRSTNGEAIDLLTDAHQQRAVEVAGRGMDRYRMRGNGEVGPMPARSQEYAEGATRQPDVGQALHIFSSVAADDAGDGYRPPGAARSRSAGSSPATAARARDGIAVSISVPVVDGRFASTLGRAGAEGVIRK